MLIGDEAVNIKALKEAIGVCVLGQKAFKMRVKHPRVTNKGAGRYAYLILEKFFCHKVRVKTSLFCKRLT